MPPLERAKVDRERGAAAYFTVVILAAVLPMVLLVGGRRVQAMSRSHVSLQSTFERRARVERSSRALFTEDVLWYSLTNPVNASLSRCVGDPVTGGSVPGRCRNGDTFRVTLSHPLVEPSPRTWSRRQFYKLNAERCREQGSSECPLELSVSMQGFCADRAHNCEEYSTVVFTGEMVDIRNDLMGMKAEKEVITKSIDRDQLFARFRERRFAR